MSPSLLSNGSDLLEGHWADRHDVHWPGGGPAFPLPAQYHHCALHAFAGHRVLHHFRAHLLQTAACSAAQRWSTPLPVSHTFFSICFCLKLLGSLTMYAATMDTLGESVSVSVCICILQDLSGRGHWSVWRSSWTLHAESYIPVHRCSRHTEAPGLCSLPIWFPQGENCEWKIWMTEGNLTVLGPVGFCAITSITLS